MLALRGLVLLFWALVFEMPGLESSDPIHGELLLEVLFGIGVDLLLVIPVPFVAHRSSGDQISVRSENSLSKRPG